MNDFLKVLYLLAFETRDFCSLGEIHVFGVSATMPFNFFVMFLELYFDLLNRTLDG